MTASQKLPARVTKDPKSTPVGTDGIVFTREYWFGDSRDGSMVNGDGYHYYRMSSDGLICEAYEVYEADDGSEVVAPLPEMNNVHWIKDLGYPDWEVLETIKEVEFARVKDMVSKPS
jgi:hypothetical protein